MPGRQTRSDGLLPANTDNVQVRAGGKLVRLTNLRKPFWPALGITKGDLLRYYAAIAPALVPHIRSRPMVMKRYPHGAAGEFFFMKRTPSPSPDWLETCSIRHDSGNVIDFPMIQDLAALLWVVNLGCIDLNQWYSRSDDVDRPDYFHFDLDPGPDVPFAQVLEASLLVRGALDTLKMPSHPKTSGSKGLHIYVPIKRGPTQKDVWTFTKALAMTVSPSTLVITTQSLPTVVMTLPNSPPTAAGLVIVVNNVPLVWNRWTAAALVGGVGLPI